MAKSISIPPVALLVTYGAQGVISLINGWLSSHPFGCVNSVTGMAISATSIFLHLKSPKNQFSETYVQWQTYSTFGFLSCSLAMLFVWIFSAGSCEPLADGCDDNTSGLGAIITLLICSLASFGIHIVLKKEAGQTYALRSRFKAIYYSVLAFGCLAWFSGIDAIDAVESFAVWCATFCYLGGASACLMSIYKVRSLIWFPIALSIQFGLSVFLLIFGVIKEGTDGEPVLKQDLLVTQVISVINLGLSSACCLVSYFGKWEYQVSKEHQITSESYSMEANVVNHEVGGKKPVDSTGSDDSM